MKRVQNIDIPGYTRPKTPQTEFGSKVTTLLDKINLNNSQGPTPPPS